MKASNKALELIKKYEGLSLKAYKCPSGQWTIGYGHTKNVKPDTIITREKAEELLDEDIGQIENELNKIIKVELSQNQFDALISFVFNIGTGRFKNSGLLKLINKRKFKEAADEFMKWTKALVNGVYRELPGLVRRRKEEKELFESL